MLRLRRGSSCGARDEGDRGGRIQGNLAAGSVSALMTRRGGDLRCWRRGMLTTGLNALALVRFGGFRLAHGGGRDGFAWLVMGLAAIGVAVWAVARADRNQPAKS